MVELLQPYTLPHSSLCGEFCAYTFFTAAKLTEADVHTEFRKYGTIMNMHLPRAADAFKGFGFVRYNDTDEVCCPHPVVFITLLY
jgi:RNA recognition motif-containing protein